MAALKRGSSRWAPWPGGGAHRVMVTGSPRKGGTVPVIWESGPLKGREATLAASTLRTVRRDAEALAVEEDDEHVPS